MEVEEKSADAWCKNDVFRSASEGSVGKRVDTSQKRLKLIEEYELERLAWDVVSRLELKYLMLAPYEDAPEPGFSQEL